MTESNLTTSNKTSILVTQEVVKTVGFCLAVILSFRGILNFLGSSNPGQLEHYLNVITNPLVSPFNNYSVGHEHPFELPILASIGLIVVIFSVSYVVLGFVYKMLNTQTLEPSPKKNEVVAPTMPLTLGRF